MGYFASIKSLPVGEAFKFDHKSQRPRAKGYFCFGCGLGDGVAGAAGALFSFCMIDVERLRVANTVNEMEVSMNRMAHQVVTLESNVAVPRGPKAVWLPAPPKVA